MRDAMRRVARAVLLLFTALAAFPLIALDVEGPLEGEFYEGLYDDQYQDDWFYDEYGVPGMAEWEDDSWYLGDELFSGLYDDGDPENDWFFDSYGEPSRDGLFDV